MWMGTSGRMSKKRRRPQSSSLSGWRISAGAVCVGNVPEAEGVLRPAPQTLTNLLSPSYRGHGCNEIVHHGLRRTADNLEVNASIDWP